MLAFSATIQTVVANEARQIQVVGLGLYLACIGLQSALAYTGLRPGDEGTCS